MDIQELIAKCDRIEKTVMSNNTLLQSIVILLHKEQAAATKHQKLESTRKPSRLPIESEVDMILLQTISNEEFEHINDYFANMSAGNSLKEFVDKCFEEAFSEYVLLRYTWTGTHGQLAFNDNNILKAIYAGVKRHPSFSGATRAEVGVLLENAFESAKQKARTGAGQNRPDRNFWEL